jgi:hypothetical protein
MNQQSLFTEVGVNATFMELAKEEWFANGAFFMRIEGNGNGQRNTSKKTRRQILYKRLAVGDGCNVLVLSQTVCSSMPIPISILAPKVRDCFSMYDLKIFSRSSSGIDRVGKDTLIWRKYAAGICADGYLCLAVKDAATYFINTSKNVISSNPLLPL